MIELPESLVLARQLNETVRGKRIAHVTAAQSPHRFAWYSGDPATYDARLKGQTITGADVYSGSVRVTLDDLSLLIGTPIKFHAPGERRPAKHQLLVEFEDGSAISCTVQMWGCMFCYRRGDEADGLPKGHITKRTPTPLADAFDEAYLRKLAVDTPPSVPSTKGFLATEQRIPGLGNGVLQDILWAARLHPKRKLVTLGDDDWQRLHGAVRSVLTDMTTRGGRDTERDLLDQPGGYVTVLSKNTVGLPCPACGSLIKKEAYLGGAIYYCPQCQSLS